MRAMHVAEKPPGHRDSPEGGHYAVHALHGAGHSSAEALAREANAVETAHAIVARSVNTAIFNDGVRVSLA